MKAAELSQESKKKQGDEKGKMRGRTEGGYGFRRVGIQEGRNGGRVEME